MEKTRNKLEESTYRVLKLQVKVDTKLKQSRNIIVMKAKTDEMIHIPGDENSGFFSMFRR